MFTTLRTIAHVLLPIFCPSLSVSWFCRCPCHRATCVMNVSVSTLLTGRCGRNYLYLNRLGNKSLAKRSFRKGGLADSCRCFNLATPSSSVYYHECVPNRACQEGRNFAPVHATCPRRCSCVLSLWQDPGPGMTCFPVGLPSGPVDRCNCPGCTRPMATCVMTVSVSTLLTGRFGRNCLDLN